VPVTFEIMKGVNLVNQRDKGKVLELPTLTYRLSLTWTWINQP